MNDALVVTTGSVAEDANLGEGQPPPYGILAIVFAALGLLAFALIRRRH